MVIHEANTPEMFREQHSLLKVWIEPVFERFVHLTQRIESNLYSASILFRFFQSALEIR